MDTMPEKTVPKAEEAPREVDEGQQLEEFIDRLRGKYQEVIDKLAQDIFRMVRGKCTSFDEVQDLLDERIDMHGWVIHDPKAKLVCMISDNFGSWWEEYGDSLIDEGGSLDWSALASCAIRFDVRAALDAKGMDLTDPYFSKNYLGSWAKQAYQKDIPEAVVLWCALNPPMAEELHRALEEEDKQTIDAHVTKLEVALDKVATLDQLHELVEATNNGTIDALTAQLSELEVLDYSDLPLFMADLPTTWSITALEAPSPEEDAK